MPPTKVKKLSSFFRPVVRAAVNSAVNPSSSSSSSSVRRSVKSPLLKTQIDASTPDTVPTVSDGSAKQASRHLSSILCGYSYWGYDVDLSEDDDDDKTSENDSDLSWFSNLFHGSPLRRKEMFRERKIKWIFKNTQKDRFDKLVSMCLDKLGSGSTIQMLCKLGRETGLKEYNACIKGCIETARSSKDEKFQMEQVLGIYQLFQLMKERGFPIEEKTFGPFLLYLIDMHLTEQFFLFLEIVKDEDPRLHPRLGYYEMLFRIEMNDVEKIQELCDQNATGESELGSLLHENYLLALCERDKAEQLHQLLEIVDITRISSLDNIACIFQSLGKLSLESIAESSIKALKSCDRWAQSVSDMIYYYAISRKNIAVEDVILKFKEMHDKLDVELLPGSYEKLITFCCDSHKVHSALDLVDEMCEAGLPLSKEKLNSICRACEDASEYILVRRIHSMLCHHDLKANSETFRSIIYLNVRMKDFDSAYAVFKDLKMFGVKPTASMYNVIIAGYYREKNMTGVLRVLEEMKLAGVKPDPQTFCYLISNSTSEEEIGKYFEELNPAVLLTKHIWMSLINAYGACGELEKAKQVVLDTRVPEKNITEIKSVLLSTLATHGQIGDALGIYMEIKQNGGCAEPKAILSLIEHLQSEGELSILLELLDELTDPSYWVDGCCRVILYCVRNKDLRAAVNLLRKLADHFQNDEMAREVIFDEVFSVIADMEPPDLQIGIDLLYAVKEDLQLHPSRKCLDFLLNACVSAKDLQKSQVVWKEYEIAGFPYNILSYLRMYQAYLASGSTKAATKFLKQIPTDDPHVRSVILACGVTYGKPKDKKKK